MAVVTETPKKRGPRPKVAKIPWGRRDGEGELLDKISERPVDFDAEKHEPLRRKDFDNAANFFDYRAADLQERADEYRTAAANERSGKGKATQAKQKRLLSLKEKFETLRKELESAGVNVDAALAEAMKG